jgi:hypothetical protein
MTGKNEAGRFREIPGAAGLFGPSFKRHLKNNQPAGEAGVIMRTKPLKGPAPPAF